MVHSQRVDQHHRILGAGRRGGEAGGCSRQRRGMREGKERRDGEYYKMQDLETGKEKLACIAHPSRP